MKELEILMNKEVAVDTELKRTEDELVLSKNHKRFLDILAI